MSLTCGMPFATGSITVSGRSSGPRPILVASRTRYYSAIRVMSGSQSSNESKKATKVLRSGMSCRTSCRCLFHALCLQCKGFMDSFLSDDTPLNGIECKGFNLMQSWAVLPLLEQGT